MTDTTIQLREYADMVSRDLFRYIPEESLPSHPLPEAMRYSLLSGGKRSRGVLLLAFYRLFRRDVTAALPWASAVEMIHAYSLIHDDLPCMDDDDLRRGVPSCHIAFGEANALLAGDGLLTLAFETAASARFPAKRSLRAIRLLARCAGMRGMVAGQVMDLANENRTVSARELDVINDRKTGAMFCASAQIGCILGGASRRQVRAAGEYARLLGRAFQIVDDALDETGSSVLLGKPTGSDRANRKNTYAALYGAQRCREIAGGLAREAERRLRAAGMDDELLCGIAQRQALRNH